MSFYRTVLAAIAAVAIASPVFADDNNNAQPAQNPSDNTAKTVQLSDNSQSASDQQNATDTKISLNKANTKELMKVKGLNASKARAIVAYRKKHGDFKSTDDLMKVKGFKKIKTDQLKEIQDQVSVD